MLLDPQVHIGDAGPRDIDDVSRLQVEGLCLCAGNDLRNIDRSGYHTAVHVSNHEDISRLGRFGVKPARIQERLDHGQIPLHVDRAGCFHLSAHIDLAVVKPFDKNFELRVLQLNRIEPEKLCLKLGGAFPLHNDLAYELEHDFSVRTHRFRLIESRGKGEFDLDHISASKRYRRGRPGFFRLKGLQRKAGRCALSTHHSSASGRQGEQRKDQDELQ